MVPGPDRYRSSAGAQRRRERRRRRRSVRRPPTSSGPSRTSRAHRDDRVGSHERPFIIRRGPGVECPEHRVYSGSRRRRVSEAGRDVPARPRLRTTRPNLALRLWTRQPAMYGVVVTIISGNPPSSCRSVRGRRGRGRPRSPPPPRWPVAPCRSGTGSGRGGGRTCSTRYGARRPTSAPVRTGRRAGRRRAGSAPGRGRAASRASPAGRLAAERAGRAAQGGRPVLDVLAVGPLMASVRPRGRRGCGPGRSVVGASLTVRCGPRDVDAIP
jgi:hypothetical protein